MFFSTKKVMNDSHRVFFQYEPLWYEGKPYGISLTMLTPLCSRWHTFKMDLHSSKEYCYSWYNTFWKFASDTSHQK